MSFDLAKLNAKRKSIIIDPAGNVRFESMTGIGEARPSAHMGNLLNVLNQCVQYEHNFNGMDLIFPQKMSLYFASFTITYFLTETS